jgi:hypothetical protein
MNDTIYLSKLEVNGRECFSTFCSGGLFGDDDRDATPPADRDSEEFKNFMASKRSEGARRLTALCRQQAGFKP